MLSAVLVNMVFIYRCADPVDACNNPVMICELISGQQTESRAISMLNLLISRTLRHQHTQKNRKTPIKETLTR